MPALGRVEWFIIQSGPDEGRLHISGWMFSTIGEYPGRFYSCGPAKGNPKTGRGVASCPVCFALVEHDDDSGHGDLTWDHEKWHHDSGTFPVPAELLEQGSWTRK